MPDLVGPVRHPFEGEAGSLGLRVPAAVLWGCRLEEALLSHGAGGVGW